MVRLLLLKPAKFGSLKHITGMADPWGMSFFPSPEAFLAFYSFLWLLLLALVCFVMMPRAKQQVGVRAGAEAGPARQGEGSGGLGQAQAWPWLYPGLVGAAEAAGDSLSPPAFCSCVAKPKGLLRGHTTERCSPWLG